jgi:glycerol-3-phosphate acyltransferase PlsX
MVHVSLDAMGGDHAPQTVVEGAVAAINFSRDTKVFLVGKEEEIRSELGTYTYDADRAGR